jgi:hypothetical protein
VLATLLDGSGLCRRSLNGIVLAYLDLALRAWSKLHSGEGFERLASYLQGEIQGDDDE